MLKPAKEMREIAMKRRAEIDVEKAQTQLSIIKDRIDSLSNNGYMSLTYPKVLEDVKRQLIALGYSVEREGNTVLDRISW